MKDDANFHWKSVAKDNAATYLIWNYSQLQWLFWDSWISFLQTLISVRSSRFISSCKIIEVSVCCGTFPNMASVVRSVQLTSYEYHLIINSFFSFYSEIVKFWVYNNDFVFLRDSLCVFYNNYFKNYCIIEIINLLLDKNFKLVRGSTKLWILFKTCY